MKKKQKPKKPTKAPRKPKGGTSVMDTLAGLISTLEALRAAVEAMTKEMAKSGVNGGVPVTASLGDLRGLGNFHAG